jgi:hypothetical protein
MGYPRGTGNSCQGWTGSTSYGCRGSSLPTEELRRKRSGLNADVTIETRVSGRRVIGKHEYVQELQRSIVINARVANQSYIVFISNSMASQGEASFKRGNIYPNADHLPITAGIIQTP